MQLMEAAEVEVGDGHWTTSYQFDSIGCVLYSAIVDVCAPTRGSLSGNAGRPAPDYSRAVTNKALTSNVATLTSVAHGLLIGDSVVVAGVDATFNGTYTITAAGADTFSYALTHANVASASSSGTATGPDHAPASAAGRDGFVFAVITSMRGRAQCSSGMEQTWVKDALDAETEKGAGKTLWDGLGATADAYLESPDVATVTPGATILETIALLLVDYWDIATGVKEEDTLLHVGISHLLTLSNQGVLDGDQRLKGTKIRVVSSPGYAADAAAVTGPVRMRISSDQVIAEHDTSVNDLNNEATRLVALEFDPCIAVRAT